MKKNTNKIFKGAVATTMILNVVSPITAFANDDYKIIDSIDYVETDVEAVVETVEEETYDYVEGTEIVEEVTGYDEFTVNEDTIIEVVEEKEIEEIETLNEGTFGITPFIISHFECEGFGYLVNNIIFDYFTVADWDVLESDYATHEQKEQVITNAFSRMRIIDNRLGSNHTFQVTSINGIEILTGLESLTIQFQNVNDVSVLSSLTNLTHLDLLGNQISNIATLGSLSNLVHLNLGGNQISNVNGLGTLTNLEWLLLDSNAISDISSLGDLTNLEFLEISGNQILDLRSLSNLNAEINANWQTINLSDVETGIATSLSIFDIDGTAMQLGVGSLIGAETNGEFTFENGQLVWQTSGSNQTFWTNENSERVFNGIVIQTVTGNNLNDDNGNDNNNDNGSDNNGDSNNDNNNDGSDSNDNDGSDENDNNVTPPPSDNNANNNNNNGQTLPQTGAIETSFALMGGFMLSTGAVVSFIKNKKQ